MTSSKCSHSKHCVAIAGKRLFLAGKMTGGFRTVSVPPPGDTGTKSDGTDPRPGYSSAGWHPGAVKDDLNSEENTQCQARDFGYFQRARQTVTVCTVCARGSMTIEVDVYMH